MVRGTLIAAVLTLAIAARGQEPPAYPLSLSEARQRAQDQTHAVQEQRAAVEQAAARQRVAAAAGLPQVAVEGRASRLSNVPDALFAFPGLGTFDMVPNVPHQYRAAVSVRAPLFTGFRLRHQEEAAESGLSASRHELEVRRQGQAADAESAYWNLHRARASASTVAQSVHLVEEHLGDVVRRQQAGVAEQEEVLEAQVRLTETQLRLVQAEHAAELAQAALARLVDLPLDTQFALVDSLRSVTVEPPTLADLQQRAARQRPELQALQSRVTAAQQQAGAARGDEYPQVALTAEYAADNPNARYFPPASKWHETWVVGVGATWTAWDWGLTRQQVRAASAQAHQAQEQLQSLSEAVSLEVLRSRLSAVEAARRLELAARGIAQADERLRNLRQRYAAGTATTTEVLDAEVALERARLSQVEALADQRIAWSELERSVGGAVR